MTPEGKVLKDILSVLESCADVHVMRNSVGMARHGQRRVRYGLENGSSDVVAIVSPRGRWLCIEAKAPGEDAEPHQREWLEKMKSFGAVCGVARSSADAMALLADAREESI